MVELFHVDLAAIFSFSTLLSFSLFFFFSLSALLEDVLECSSTQACTLFPCGPSAAAVQPLQPHGDPHSPTPPPHHPHPLSHLTSHGNRSSSKIQITAFKKEKKNQHYCPTREIELFKGLNKEAAGQCSAREASASDQDKYEAI